VTKIFAVRGHQQYIGRSENRRNVVGACNTLPLNHNVGGRHRGDGSTLIEICAILRGPPNGNAYITLALGKGRKGYVETFDARNPAEEDSAKLTVR
jgi:hypothetical protein